MQSASILPNPMLGTIARAIQAAKGWIGFDIFMQLALYAPGLGYYANASTKFGVLPQSKGGHTSDFVTAPEMTPLFGQVLATQIAQALQATQTTEIFEFGAGTGALAGQVLGALDALGLHWQRYTIVEVSGHLRTLQRQRLQRWGDKVQWADHWPNAMCGVAIGNEVLDAMPVQLLVRKDGQWFERGVAMGQNAPQDSHGSDGEPILAQARPLIWQDQPTALRPPVAIEGDCDYLTEIHPQAEAFVRSLAHHLAHGAVFLVDYGFAESEFYHPQRHMGTLMCHRAHLADTDPLQDPGHKDITAHVNFSGIALAAQDAGLDVVGYCNQARFLMNCGILDALKTASMQDKSMAQKLLLEHEMGELFKVIALAKPSLNANPGWIPLGFVQGDRTHTL